MSSEVVVQKDATTLKVTRAPKSGRHELQQQQPKKEMMPWKVNDSRIDSLAVKNDFRYLHKKFKKMDSTIANDGLEHELSATSGDHVLPPSKPANPSLEALFQVTGHELEKMKSEEVPELQRSQNGASSSSSSALSSSSSSPTASECGKKCRELLESSSRDDVVWELDRTCAKDDPVAGENGPEERELVKRLRSNRHVCPYCGLACGKPSVLQKHVRAHTNERPYPCVTCGFAFKTKSNLYKHCKSRAHHLKTISEEGSGVATTEKTLSAVGREPSFEGSGNDRRSAESEEADVIETDDSTNSERDLGEDDEDDEGRRPTILPLTCSKHPIDGRSGITTTVPGISVDDHDLEIKSDNSKSLLLQCSSLSSMCSDAVVVQANDAERPSSSLNISEVGPTPGTVCTTISTSIYKPKFHSVSYSVPSPQRISGVSETGHNLEMTIDHSSPEGQMGKSTRETPRDTRPSAGGTPGNSVGLAKRRLERFPLRLEIPRPRTLVQEMFGSCTSSSASSSSCSSATSLVHTTGPSVSCTPSSLVSPNASCTINESGLLSVEARGDGCNNPTATTSSNSHKSTKLTSPEYIQERISKLISQNAAIVETLDLWPRRYTRQSSIASSHNVDAELRSKERSRRFSEDVAVTSLTSSTSVTTATPSLPTKSKLALALLAATSTESSEPRTRNTEASAVSSSGGNTLYRSAASTFLSSSNVVRSAPILGTSHSSVYRTPSSHSGSKESIHADSNDPLSVNESPRSSIVKSLLMVTTTASGSFSAKGDPASLPDAHHPQNPEGSIIKDLLLKTRNGSNPQSTTSSSAACMRLSGGSISSGPVTVAANVLGQQKISQCKESTTLVRQPGEEPLPEEEEEEVIAVYTCPLCHVSYKKTNDLETHHCQRTSGSPVSGVDSSFILSASESRTPGRSSTPASLPLSPLVPNISGISGTAVLSPLHHSCTPGIQSCHKPRGRPRGSKNRPKSESPIVSVARISISSGRTHSKSVSETSFADNREGCEWTSDTAKEKLGFRRNSVSGDLTGKVKETPFGMRRKAVDGDEADGAETGSETDSSVASLNYALECGGNSLDGPILKKHLLSGSLTGDKSPPLKKRKVPDDLLQNNSNPLRIASVRKADTMQTLKSLEHLSKHPMRSSAVHLFGGEVQICDGTETKKIVIDGKPQVPLQQHQLSESLLGELRTTDATSSVVATIAKPVHNSGGTVLQVQEAKSTLGTSSVCIPAVSIGRPLMATGTVSARATSADLSAGAIVLSSSPVSLATTRPFAIDISHLKLDSGPVLPKTPSFASFLLKSSPSFRPGSISPPSTAQTPSSSSTVRVVYGSAADPNEKVKASSEGPTRSISDVCVRSSSPKAACKDLRTHHENSSPTLTSETPRSNSVPVIAIHSPHSPSAHGGDGSPKTQEPLTVGSATGARLLAPPRPTTLPLKAAQASMVGMTMASPETPRPKKKYGQCYINGQYYTYLELKQSTRVYYCNCRPLPMYVPQSVDPKLSMYSMWQTVPATPDPFGLTPPQAMSLYTSKPRYRPYTVAKPTKVSLVVTHSSYWTFQQNEKRDHTNEKPLEENVRVRSFSFVIRRHLLFITVVGVNYGCHLSGIYFH